MKSLSPLLSGVLYTGIVIVSVILAMNILGPVVEKMKDRAAFEEARSFMASLDKTIQKVVKEGRYSTRVISLDFSRGKYIIDNKTNRIKYELETEAKLVSPGTMKKVGNLIIASGDDVKVEDLGNVIRMSNSYLQVNFTKIGNESSYAPVNLSQMITEIKLIKENITINPGIILKFSDVESGNGYVKAEMGENLPVGKVIVHVKSGAMSFDVVYTLKSYADFITLSVKNVKIE